MKNFIFCAVLKLITYVSCFGLLIKLVIEHFSWLFNKKQKTQNMERTNRL